MKKIIVSCDCNGSLEALFTKVSELHIKNRFDALLLLGNVCTSQSADFMAKIVKGSFVLSLPVYFIDNSPISRAFNAVHPQGLAIAPNLTLLGAYGVKNIVGVTVGYVGADRECIERTPSLRDGLELFVKKCEEERLDLLLTNEWPNSIRKMLKKEECQSNWLDNISYISSPQYHFAAGSDSFYRMDPFEGKKGNPTHFISVAPILAGQLTGKYLFAIQIIPFVDETTLRVAPDEPKIINPFLSTQAEPQKAIESRNALPGDRYIPKEMRNQRSSLVTGSTYVFFSNIPVHARSSDISQFLERWGQIEKIEVYEQSKGRGKSGIVKFRTVESTRQCLGDSGKHTLYQQRIKFQPRHIEEKYRNDDCWFCTGNPNFDSSLVLYRGSYCYISLEKGPLAKYHLQIIPYNHVKSTGRLEGVEADEINSINDRLNHHFQQQGYTVFSYQRCLNLSESINHCIIHIIPVLNRQGHNLLQQFKALNSDDQLHFKETQERKTDHYVYLRINNTKFMKEIQRREKVASDFMRRIFCELLSKPQLLFWKDCQRKQEELQTQKAEMLLTLGEMGLKSL